MMRELCGDDGEKLAKVAVKIALGKLELERYDMFGNPYKVKPNYKERLDALQFCRDTGWGKPAQTIELANKDGEAFEVKAEVTANVEPSAIEKVIQFATGLGFETATGAAASIGEGASAEVDEIHSAPAAPDTAILPSSK
jgi:hypothetical protein